MADLYENIQFDKETGEIKPRKLYIRNRQDGSSKPVDDTVEDALVSAGWSDDPGTGKAVLTPDGREIVSPAKIAPPIGYTAEKSVMEMISEMMERRLAALNDADEVDSEEEVNDFGEDDEPAPWSPYEVELVDEYPAIPKETPPDPAPEPDPAPPSPEPLP